MSDIKNEPPDAAARDDSVPIEVSDDALVGVESFDSGQDQTTSAHLGSPLAPPVKVEEDASAPLDIAIADDAGAEVASVDAPGTGRVAASAPENTVREAADEA